MTRVLCAYANEGFGLKIWCITGMAFQSSLGSHRSTLSKQELPVPLLFESELLDVTFRLLALQFKSQDYTCANLSGSFVMQMQKHQRKINITSH